MNVTIVDSPTIVGFLPSVVSVISTDRVAGSTSIWIQIAAHDPYIWLARMGMVSSARIDVAALAPPRTISFVQVGLKIVLSL